MACTRQIHGRPLSWSSMSVVIQIRTMVNRIAPLSRSNTNVCLAKVPLFKIEIQSDGEYSSRGEFSEQ